MPTYSELLRDPRWQKKRLEIMQRDKFSCRSCGDATETLNVHHCYYEYGKDPWDYPDLSLLTLCETCHKEETDNIKAAKADLLKALGERGAMADDYTNLTCALSHPPRPISITINNIDWMAHQAGAYSLIGWLNQRFGWREIHVEEFKQGVKEWLECQ